MNTEQPAKILVLGIGGSGCNLVNRLSDKPPVGVELVLANTDAQALLSTRKGPKVVFLGEGATRGLGAGADHRLGEKAAQQSIGRLEELFRGVDMVFLTAGMGGGTGTGAAPVAAEAARRAGALVVAVVTTPFLFEGHRRTRVAREGVAALAEKVDSLLVLPNERLLTLESGSLPLDECFKTVDQVLCDAVRGMTELVTIPGVINLDFADVRAVLSNSGRAIFGMATAPTAQRAVEQALSNPLVGGSPDGAGGCLLNITAGPDMTLEDYSAACSLLQESASPDAMVLCGFVQDDSMVGRARATVVATRVNPIELHSSANRPLRQVVEQHLPEPSSSRVMESKSSDVLPLAKAALPSNELTAFERRQRSESQEFSFSAPNQKPQAMTPKPRPVAATPASPNPNPGPISARSGLVRKGTTPEPEKKSKWMDLPAIWRRKKDQ